jgi:hypothetical protein
MSAKEYREFADGCMHWAKLRSDQEKRIFLQMIEAWLQAAILAERREQRGVAVSDQQKRNSAEA